LDTTITFINPSVFDITFKPQITQITQIQIIQIGTISIPARGKASYTINPYIPDNLSSGKYLLEITLDKKYSFPYVIPEANPVLKTRDMAIAGEELELTIENIGGVDYSSDFRF
jgi:hypothetical protein